MKIEEMRQKYSLTKDDVWSLERGGRAVAVILKHDAVLKIANQEGITFEKPEVLESPERSPVQRIAVLITAVSADGKKKVYDIGEADKTNTKIAYFWSLALKRGQDRAVLKLIAAEGVYSDSEADDFEAKNAPEPTRVTPAVVNGAPVPKPTPKNPCDECGSEMIERKNKKTGKPFLGCSGWPQCNNMRPVTGA